MKSIPRLQMTMALALALGLGGCQTMSDMGDAAGNAASSVGDVMGGAVAALDPTTWFGDDTAPTETATNDTNASTSPDLANLPSRPATSSPAQQQATAQSLAADGAQARYSADNLRAGTEAAAAPPPSAADIPPSAQLAANAPPSAQPPSAQPPSAQPAPPPTAAPSAALAQGTAAVPTPGAATRTAAIAPTRAAPPPGAEPAVPANTPVRGGNVRGQAMSDAAFGFRPSSAPPLDANINQWVAAPIVARYRQTASNAGVAAAAVPAVPPKGGAAAANGPVMANLDAVSTGPGGMAGGTPSAVVMFAGDGVTLSAAAKNEVKLAAAQYRSSGGSASIRVVGHASSRTGNMPVEKHLELIFEKSQQRANAVAQELIHDGVPADRVLIEAVGDSQPVFYESMPQGEEGNRRAEIFVQG